MPRYNEPFPVTKKSEMSKFRSSRFVGVEWEFNEVRGSTELLKKWQEDWRGRIKEDGSCGWEAITAPVAGNFAYKSIMDLGKAFKAAKAKANRQCSVHVHVDAKDFSWDNMRRMMQAYGRVEPLLYVIGGIKRYRSTYCAPNGRMLEKIATTYKDNPRSVQASLQGFLNTVPGDDKRDGARYQGLNLCPWLTGQKIDGSGPGHRKDITVEFRIHENTLDPVEVVNWSELCAIFVDWSKQLTDDQLKNLHWSPMKILGKEVAPHLKSWMRYRLDRWRNSDRLPKPVKYKGGRFIYQGRDPVPPVPVVTIPHPDSCRCWRCHRMLNERMGTAQDYDDGDESDFFFSEFGDDSDDDNGRDYYDEDDEDEDYEDDYEEVW